MNRLQPFTVFKDARNRYRWIGITSNGYEDRDREIVSSAALAADCERADRDGLYGPLRWWHIGEPDPTSAAAPWGPGLDLGWCDFNAMSDGFLVESGTITDPQIGAALVEKAHTLGLSPGFFYAAGEPVRDGVFTTIRRFERSLAPLHAVSNPFTRFSAHQEAGRDEEKLKVLSTLVGVKALASSPAAATLDWAQRLFTGGTR